MRCLKVEKPTKKNTKKEIKKYMKKAGIDYNKSDTKKELLNKIDDNKTFNKSRENVDLELDQIHPNFKNPRKGDYDKDDMEILKESMKSMGQINNIVVDENGVLLAGHRRYEVAKQLGWDTLRADIKAGLSEFEKSAIMLSDNATRKDFKPWEHRKAINDIYWNEFCEEYEFKSEKDKGYSAFGKAVGMSIATVSKIIKSMRKENIALANKLRKEGVSTTTYDEVLNTPKKYRNEIVNEVVKLSKDNKNKSGSQIREKIRAKKKKLRLENQKEKLHPNLFQALYRKIDSINTVLSKDVIKNLDYERCQEIKKKFKNKLIPVYKELKKKKKKSTSALKTEEKHS